MAAAAPGIKDQIGLLNPRQMLFLGQARRKDQPIRIDTRIARKPAQILLCLLNIAPEPEH